MHVFSEIRKQWLICLVGTILFIFGITVIIWNEGRAVQTILSLDEALSDSLTINAEKVFDGSYHGRLVHIKGPLNIGEPLTEPDYNIQVMAVKLKRRVQMYQWVEEIVEGNYRQWVYFMENDDILNNYHYTLDWKDELIDSRSFYFPTGHQNPKTFPVASQIQLADVVKIGEYQLGSAIKERFHYIEFTSDTRPEITSIKMHMGLYYHSNDLFIPEVGDLRIHFSYAGQEGEVYTIVGKLNRSTIVPYEASNGKKVLLVYPGKIDLYEAFQLEYREQRIRTWVFRLSGWFLIFFAGMTTSPIISAIMKNNCLMPNPGSPLSTNIILSFSIALSVASITWAIQWSWISAGYAGLMLVVVYLWCARIIPIQKK